jgi:hypothetical protein
MEPHKLDSRVARHMRHSSLRLSCERRLGCVVHAAAPAELLEVSTRVGSLRPRKSPDVVLALTDDGLHALDLRLGLSGLRVGAAICQWPRVGLVAAWRRRWWMWPHSWTTEMSWPALGASAEFRLIGGPETDRLMGLLLVDDFERQLARSAPALGA